MLEKSQQGRTIRGSGGLVSKIRRHVLLGVFHGRILTSENVDPKYLLDGHKKALF